jgi:hypothetical protein
MQRCWTGLSRKNSRSHESPPQFASIDEALDSHTVADGDAEAWTELLVRLHVRHCLLAYSPHGVDEWTRTERATLKTIGTKAAAAISGLLTRAKAKPADPKIPWLGVAGVILEYSLLTAAEMNILCEKRAQTAGKMPDEVLNLEVRILNDLDLVLHLESGEAFRELEKNLNTIRLGINDWRGATCDLLLTRVEMKREELPYEEWATLLTYPAEIIDMTIRAEENAFDLIDAHGARETFPYVTKEFWAWRLGRCIAAGAHLLPEIQERLDKRERFENHKPLPAAIDILLGFGSDRDDWHKLRANLVRATVNVWEASAWLGVNDVGDATVDMLKQTFEERLSPSIGLVGPTSDLYWLVRVG